MKTIFRSASTLCLAAAIAVLVAAAPKTAPEIGGPAPSFELKDLDGKTHKLSDFKGKNVVLEWYNPGCPYCKGIYESGVVTKTLEGMKAIKGDHVYIAVNSTGNMPEDQVADQSRRLLEKSGLDGKVPVLLDHDGTVGKAYGARTTPHMFVIDSKGVLRYAGAYTDDPLRKNAEPTNYVLNALAQIAAGETVSPDQTDPWGCGVKYKKK